MRTIKFRGKDIISGELVYGDLIHGVGSKAGKCFILPLQVNLAYVKNCDPLDGVEVDPETVGQFTGLLDKNGKEIFEHDIVQGISKNAVYEVFYNQDLCGFSTKIGLVGLLECTVIGNAIDNPELLKD